jgi:hypothetical protein
MANAPRRGRRRGVPLTAGGNTGGWKERRGVLSSYRPRDQAKMLLRLTALNHLRTPPIFNQVPWVHPLRRLEGGSADQEVGSPGQHLVTAICADDLEWAIFREHLARPIEAWLKRKVSPPRTGGPSFG